ncbi:MAG: hypothetical protein QNJ91_07930 [Gammaproteobacteria bacterium]|nr:hypothetical protein [Gammaproteobacteria bacterium]
MRALFKLLFLLVLLVVPLLLVGAFFALSDTPVVERQVTLSHADIARAKAVLKRNDPRYLPAGAYRTIEIAASDLDLAANYLLQRFADAKARLSLSTDVLNATASVRVPRLPLRRYVNLRTAIRSEGGRPRITGLRIGSVPVPDIVSNAALQWLVDDLAKRASYQLGSDLVQDLRLFPDRLRLTYRWNPAVIDQARDTLLSGSDRDALRHYHDQLVTLQARNIGRKGSLVELLGPIFQAARVRSQSYDPVMENTALLTVLGTWASRQNLARLVPGNLARPTGFRLKLHRRTDFAQHFLTSAALAARSDSALSDAVGLFKEINDTDSGTGFSFTDIAADRAGTRFGALATRSVDDARRVQQRLAAGVAETDVMPVVDDLPEHLRGAVFKERFGHVGSPAYHAVMDDIERRIDASALYRE